MFTRFAPRSLLFSATLAFVYAGVAWGVENSVPPPPFPDCPQKIEREAPNSVVPSLDFAQFVMQKFDRPGLLTVARRHLKSYFQASERLSVTPDDILQDLFLYLAQSSQFTRLENTELSPRDPRVIAYVNTAIKHVVLKTRRKEQAAAEKNVSIFDHDGEVLRIPELSTTDPHPPEVIANEFPSIPLTELEELSWFEPSLTKDRITQTVDKLAQLYQLSSRQFFLHRGGEYSWGDIREALAERAIIWQRSFAQSLSPLAHQTLLDTVIGEFFAQLYFQIYGNRHTAARIELLEKILTPGPQTLLGMRSLVDRLSPDVLNFALALWKESGENPAALSTFTQLLVEKIPAFAVRDALKITKQAIGTRTASAFEVFRPYVLMADQYPIDLVYRQQGKIRKVPTPEYWALILYAEAQLKLWITTLQLPTTAYHEGISRMDLMDTVTLALTHLAENGDTNFSTEVLQAQIRSALLQQISSLAQTSREVGAEKVNPFRCNSNRPQELKQRIAVFWRLSDEQRSMLHLCWRTHCRLESRGATSPVFEGQRRAFELFFVDGFHPDSPPGRAVAPNHLRKMLDTLAVMWDEISVSPLRLAR